MHSTGTFKQPNYTFTTINVIYFQIISKAMTNYGFWVIILWSAHTG